MSSTALTPYTEVSPNVSQQYTTYQELRRQNREEYVTKMAEKYRRSPLGKSLRIVDQQKDFFNKVTHPVVISILH